MKMWLLWAWPIAGFVLGQLWLGFAIWEQLGATFAFAWWGAWMIAASVVEWFGPA